METGLQIAIVVNIVGISIAVWFLRSRLKAKLAEVEERQAQKKTRLAIQLAVLVHIMLGRTIAPNLLAFPDIHYIAPHLLNYDVQPSHYR